ncbi:MAG: glycine/betaine/sarcosine/D-proline family reductase selenoprotein B, partial [Paeniclostridium sordellii]|nr:glycine/betaine/sarcosine/D-proline family reductase selenoprotein B [Paeniclostridium sordellii]
ICKKVEQELKIPVVTGMYIENPGVDMYKLDLYIIETKNSAADLRKTVPKMVNLGLKLAKSEEVGPPEEEGYILRGIRKNFFHELRGSERAIDMLVKKLNKDNIPNISQMDKDYLNLKIDPGNKYSVPYMFGTVGLVYNKDVVKEKVDSWDILWNEKYKDKIFMFDTYRDTMGAALKKLGYSLNTTNPKEIEEAKNLLISQRKSVNPIYGVDNGTTMIPAGESDINMIWSGEGLNLQEENPNLVYVVPKEGANFWIDSLCIPNNAKNVEGAEKFINFVSDKESALRIADEIGYTTPNKEARLKQPEKVKNNPNAYMPKEIMERCEIYTDFPSDVKRLYDDAWTQIKSDN